MLSFDLIGIGGFIHGGIYSHLTLGVPIGLGPERDGGRLSDIVIHRCDVGGRSNSPSRLKLAWPGLCLADWLGSIGSLVITGFEAFVACLHVFRNSFALERDTDFVLHLASDALSHFEVGRFKLDIGAIVLM